MEDDGGRGDKQLKRGVFFLYSEMRHPHPGLAYIPTVALSMCQPHPPKAS